MDESASTAEDLTETPAPDQTNDKMELDRIVVGQKSKGKVLSIDKESEFIICNIGANQGVKIGDFLSVFKGDEYLGDVKVSRVQEEMSAADFVAPLSSRNVHKNDSVVLQQS